MRAALLRMVAALAVVGLVTTIVRAADDAANAAAKVDGGKVDAIKIDRLVVEPSPVVLHGADDMVQLLVTAQMADGSQRDVTHAAQFKVANPAIVSMALGQLKSTGDGGTKIHIAVKQPGRGSDVAADLEVKVEQFGVERPINFANDIIPVLSKYGCNSGGCHGKATGQNGFKLSLLGFDAAGDYESIVKQAHGRRVFPAAPERSLLLAKATGQAVHGGGRRFEMDSAAANLLRRWIEQGLPVGKPDDPSVVRIEVLPHERLLSRGSQQQLRVVATYSNDGTKDVTAEAQYQAQQPDLVAVTTGGLASTLDATGEGTIMVRYMGLVDVARLTVPYGGQLPDSSYAQFQSRGPVDELVLKKWRKLGIAPSPPCTDAEFIRRASLDAIGTLPTAEEVRAYVADASPDKRARLIDKLLDRNEYASYWALQWGDLLRNQRKQDSHKRGTFAFASWIHEAFAHNMPYDQFAAAILTAQGNVTDNPPVVWYRAVRNVVHQVNDTSQVFMGTRINCANCHHHPYERWSQDDYWGMAGFFARLGTKPGEVSDESAIYVRKDGQANQPRTGKAMKPKALGGPEFDYVRGEDPRQLLASWLAQPDNPYFAPALCNRMWAHFMGVGLVDAVDDMRLTNPPSNPELLETLSRDFIAYKFDLKHLIRQIMTSEVYALSSVPTEQNSKDRRNYARYFPKRMSAEVLADAVDSVTLSPEKYPGLPLGTRAIETPDQAASSYFMEVFGRSQRETACECEKSYAPNLAQILHLMNSSEIQNKLMNAKGRVAQLAASGKPPGQMIEELYLVTYGRLPSEAEMTEAAGYLSTAKNLKSALGDLTWVLLNTKEFLFNH
jgi:hypothetical protein